MCVLCRGCVMRDGAACDAAVVDLVAVGAYTKRK
jgi:hypothetical protein